MSINYKHKDRLFIFLFGNEAHKDWTLIFITPSTKVIMMIQKLSVSTPWMISCIWV